ncbi:MAG: hypothetical protein HOF35_16425 [Bacteroidetes bacterium]|nr:hypothetical protein [Bacteroidota bacterium]MBT7993361.1 hypothetical protein [Bacteroidota bacterium]
MKSCYLVLIILLILSNKVTAQLPLESDNAFTVGKDMFQLELCNSICKEQCPDQTSRLNLSSAVFTYGLSQKNDLVISMDYGIGHTVTQCESYPFKGFYDIKLELKRLLIEKEYFHSSIKTGLSIPTGQHERGFGSGKVGYSFYSVSTLTFNHVDININGGYIRNENLICACKNLFHFSSSIDLTFYGNFHFVANIGINKSIDIGHNENCLFNLVGFYYLLGESNELSFGYKNESSSDLMSHSLITGFTHRF